MTQTFLIGAFFLICFSLMGCDFLEEDVVRFEVISEGSYSGISVKTETVVDSMSEWTNLWEQHGSRSFPAPALPFVDFTSSVVVAIFGGDKPDGCYKLFLRDVSTDGNNVMIRYEIVNLASSDVGCTLALTQPFAMVRIQKPQGSISIIDKGSQ